MNINIDLNEWKERAMELAQCSVAKAIELTDTGVARAKELAEISKLKVQNLGEQDTIRRAYAELGRLYYAERGSAPESSYADLCKKITAAKEQIQRNEQYIAEMKRAGNLSDEEVTNTCYTGFADATCDEFDAHEGQITEEPAQEQDVPEDTQTPPHTEDIPHP